MIENQFLTGGNAMNANAINDMEKKRMMTEAQMQIRALEKINKWKVGALALSTIGVALTYAGLAGESRHLFLGILGIIFIITGIGAAFFLITGLRNGRRNVEKILDAMEK